MVKCDVICEGALQLDRAIFICIFPFDARTQVMRNRVTSKKGLSGEHFLWTIKSNEGSSTRIFGCKFLRRKNLRITISNEDYKFDLGLQVWLNTTSTTKDYKFDSGLQVRLRTTSLTEDYKFDRRLQVRPKTTSLTKDYKFDWGLQVRLRTTSSTEDDKFDRGLQIRPRTTNSTEEYKFD